MNDATRTAIQSALDAAVALVDQAMVDAEDAGEDTEGIEAVSYDLRDALDDLRAVE